MRTESIMYRDHVIAPTALKSRSGYALYHITGPVTNEYVAAGNEYLRIDGGYKRAASLARMIAAKKAAAK